VLALLLPTYYFSLQDKTTNQPLLKPVKSYERGEMPKVGEIDGWDMVFDVWRFNIRSSNTEPLIRLNIESSGDADLFAQKLKLMEGLVF